MCATSTQLDEWFFMTGVRWQLVVSAALHLQLVFASTTTSHGCINDVCGAINSHVGLQARFSGCHWLAFSGHIFVKVYIVLTWETRARSPWGVRHMRLFRWWSFQRCILRVCSVCRVLAWCYTLVRRLAPSFPWEACWSYCWRTPMLMAMVNVSLELHA